MNEALLVELAKILGGFILGGGLLGSLLGWRQQRSKEPIDRETAAVANANTAGQLALQVARHQGDSVRVLREDLSVLRSEVEELRPLRGEVRAMQEALDSAGLVVRWVQDLHDRWGVYRTQDTPPGGLPPGVLRDR